MEMTHKKVLLVDDDPGVCHLITDMAPDTWDVSTVRTGKEAGQLLSGMGGYYDLAIIDYHLPLWSGKQAVEVSKHMLGDTKILFITGDERVAVSGPILYKPFTEQQLREAVTELLGDGTYE